MNGRHAIRVLAATLVALAVRPGSLVAADPVTTLPPPTPAASGAPTAPVAPATAGATLEFLRVHVPQGRLRDVPLGDTRYVPMSPREFEAAVARSAGAVAGRTPGATVIAVSRVAVALGGNGSLSGTVSFVLDADTARRVREVPLGPLDVGRGWLRTEGGTGDVVLFGRAEAAALATPEAGTYECEFSCGPETGNPDRYRLPLIPAVAHDVTVSLPADRRLVTFGPAARRAVITREPAADGTGPAAWKIAVGPADWIGIAVVSDAADDLPTISAWTTVDVQGRQARMTTALRPSSAWLARELIVDKDPATHVLRVTVDGLDEPIECAAAADGRSATIVLPAWLEGDSQALIVDGLAPVPAVGAWSVPTVRVPAARWAGGGTAVTIDALSTVADVVGESCSVVTSEAAARWPLPRQPDRDLPAVVFVEQQGPAAALTLALKPRDPQLDVARVTTVELSPNAVLARAACDVRVRSGEAFTLTGRVASGWVIDSVEAVEWPSLDEPVDDDAAPRRSSPFAATLDWRSTGPSGNLLRITSGIGVTPDRSLGLLIRGHRPGVAFGSRFGTAEMDMVRFDGETPGTTMVDFRAAPEALVEIDGEFIGQLPLEGRLAVLGEPGVSRGRMTGDKRASDRQARLVKRRPPLDGRVQVRLAARDERLSESFLFECNSETAGLDAVVVHFSVAMGESLEWSCVLPEGTTVVPRRLEAADLTPRTRGFAESWLLELTPPAVGPVALRAAREVPFAKTDQGVAVPLAWIDGAVVPGGTVLVRDTGPERPRVINRRLRELPPEVDAAADSLPILGEFAFGTRESVSGDAPPLELIPVQPGGAEPQAWVWREETSCWVHESGQTECESVFEIENHGREVLTVSVARGRRLEGIDVDGVSIDFDRTGAAGGDTPVVLPAANRRVRLLVRTIAEANVGVGLWWIDPAACAIDVPVLARGVRVFVPPALDAAAVLGGYRSAGMPPRTWLSRLCGATPRSRAGAAAAAPQDEMPQEWDGASIIEGFRGLQFVPVQGAARTGGIVIVRRRLIGLLAVGAGLLAAAITLACGRRRLTAAALVMAAAGMAALWTPEPCDVIARGLWWGSLVGGWLALPGWSVSRGMLRAAAVLCMVVPAQPQAPAAEPSPGMAVFERPGAALEPRPAVRVFITSGSNGQTALVPEPLFRMLTAAAGGSETAAVRVAECRVLVPAAPDAPWRLTLDVDADAGGILALDQAPCGGAWRLPAAESLARLEDDGRRVRYTMPVAGRRRLELEMIPGRARRDGLDETQLCLPDAARSVLELETPDASRTADGRRLVCEVARPDSPELFQDARLLRESADRQVFDVSRAARVRLVSPVDPRATLAPAVMRRADSLNEVSWQLGACRVTGRFSLDAGDAVVRRLIVRASPGLEAVSATDAEDRPQRLVPLGGQRYLVELTPPAEGRATATVACRSPLADPAGVFELPEVWLEDVAQDFRSVRLDVSPDLRGVVERLTEVELLPAAPAANVEPQAWKYEVATPAVTAAETGATLPQPARPSSRRPRLALERVPQQVSWGQRLLVEFAADRIGLDYRAQLNAASLALVQLPVALPTAAVIDRVAVFEDDPAAAAGAARLPVDVAWSRPKPETLLVVIQRPRAGRFRLEIDARVPGAPPTRGDMPLIRSPAAITPLLAGWRTAPDAGFAVTLAAEPQTELADGSQEFEVSPQDAGPAYLAPRRATPSSPVAAGDVVSRTDQPASGGGLDDRLALTDIHLAFDARGRGWGLVRFDLTSARPVLRLRLPPGLRLFDMLADGREADAVPVAEGVWEVRLHDVRWPRTLVALFAGDVGPRIAAGAPTQFVPPRIEDLKSELVLWTIDAPPGLSLRVAEPARLLDPPAAAAMVRTARARIAEAFEQTVAAADATLRGRLLDFAEARRNGRTTSVEEAWTRSMGDRPRPGQAAGGTVVATDGDLVVRAERRGDDTVTARGVATLALAGITGLAWTLARRRPAWWPAVAAWIVRLAPVGVLLAGGAWIVLLTPTLPGWICLLAGVLGLIGGRRRSVESASPPGGPSMPFDIGRIDDTTRTFVAR